MNEVNGSNALTDAVTALTNALEDCIHDADPVVRAWAQGVCVGLSQKLALMADEAALRRTLQGERQLDVP